MDIGLNLEAQETSTFPCSKSSILSIIGPDPIKFCKEFTSSGSCSNKTRFPRRWHSYGILMWVKFQVSVDLGHHSPKISKASERNLKATLKLIVYFPQVFVDSSLHQDYD